MKHSVNRLKKLYINVVAKFFIILDFDAVADLGENCSTSQETPEEVC